MRQFKALKDKEGEKDKEDDEFENQRKQTVMELAMEGCSKVRQREVKGMRFGQKGRECGKEGREKGKGREEQEERRVVEGREWRGS